MGASFPSFPVPPSQLCAAGFREADLVFALRLWKLWNDNPDVPTERPEVSDILQYFDRVAEEITGRKTAFPTQGGIEDRLTRRLQMVLEQLVNCLSDEKEKAELRSRIREAFSMQSTLPACIPSGILDELTDSLIGQNRLSADVARALRFERNNAWRQSFIVPTPSEPVLIPRSIGHVKFRQMEFGNLEALLSGRPVDPKFASLQASIFVKLLQSKMSLSLELLESHRVVIVFLKLHERDLPQEAYLVSGFYAESTAELQYQAVLEVCAMSGITSEVLRERLLSVQYENGDFMDEVAYMIKQRLNSDITRIPFSVSCTETALISLIHRRFSDLRLDTVRSLLRGVDTTQARNLGRLLDLPQFDAEKNPNAFLDVYESVGKLLGNVHYAHYPRDVVPILIDFAEILCPFIALSAILRNPMHDTSVEFGDWTMARLCLLRVKRGSRPILQRARREMPQFKGPGIETMNSFIDEVIELMDLRFSRTDEHRRILENE